jgi:hypothetical protein
MGSYRTVSQLEEALQKKSLENDWQTFMAKRDFQSYYRHFPTLYPRHPFDPFGNDKRPVLSNVVVQERPGTYVKLVPNVKITVDVLEMENVTNEPSVVRVKLRLKALWKPALAEVRDIDDKVKCFPSVFPLAWL